MSSAEKSAERAPGSLDRFSSPTQAWFTGAFARATPAQEQAWEAISTGRNALVVAPTGSGKTLAAFLWSLDRLAGSPLPEDPRRRCRVLYVSPLKALAVDVERNLRAPLTGMRSAAVRLGLPEPDITVGIRSGDTPADERRAFGKRPPDILITTPESLFLLLTSGARDSLRGVETVIVDEVHAVAGTKRGAHLALSLERLDGLLDAPAQRIGLSATVRPVEEVARYLGGSREVAVVAPPADKTIELDVVVPVQDMSELGTSTGEISGSAAGNEVRRSIWPHVEERIVDLIESHRSTIVFANSRRLAERLCARLNEISYERATGEALPEPGTLIPAALMAQAGSTRGAPASSSPGDGAPEWREIARAHHGSVSKEHRGDIEEQLKAGLLPAVVATSSLELGIDMGAVDLMVQVESPPSVASGLQRIGRAGHGVGEVSRGVLFPKFRADLVQSAVVAERMRSGAIEALRYPRNPLDVLAQQIVAMVALDEWDIDAMYELLRRAAPYATLPRSAYESVLDMLSGRYPSDEFAELRPRLVWDRVTGTLTGRPGAQRLAVTSGGTIPDRGLYGVFLAGEGVGRRVGELDEEMVYESRAGDVFTLGSSSWRIEDITHDKVIVSPAPGVPGKLPFWKGEAIGRPLELGRALGAFVREVGALPPDAAAKRVRDAGLDEWAADNLLAYLAEQKAATGHVPDDRTIVVERFRDEIGDWRIIVHSPFGSQVHAPWALALSGRLQQQYGVDVSAMHADDGIVLRLPDTGYSEDSASPTPDVLFDADEIEGLVTAEVGGSALFAARFRECAARALLLPRRNPGRRTPLWQQRQRSAQLLSVASEYGSFPVLLETMRECLQDVFDVPGLAELLGDVAARKVRVVEVETPTPSPYAKSLLFGYVATYVYEGDAPLAERRAQALTLDAALLAELLGTEAGSLRDLLDAGDMAELERDLQWLGENRRIRDAEDVADLLRSVGPLTTAEVGERGGTLEQLESLQKARRAIVVRIAGEERWAAIEDAGRLEDALGVPLPLGIPEAFREPVAAPLADLLARYARTHAPFAASAPAARFGLGVAVVTDALHRLTASGRVVQGEFTPLGHGQGGTGTEWCDAEVLRRLRRRALASLRSEIEPVEPTVLARFLPEWQAAGTGKSRLAGVDGVLRVIEQLQGTAVPASAWESLVLPARVENYYPALLDELTSSGEVVWAGAGDLPGGDGYLSLCPADTAPLLLPEPGELELSPVHAAVLATLDGGAALFFRALSDRVGAAITDAGTDTAAPTDDELVAVMWDLVWAGHVTNDTLAPVRTGLGPRRSAGARTPARSRYGRATPRLRMPTRTGPPAMAGRWSLLPDRSTDTTRRAALQAEVLLDRHGVVTRGAVMAERAAGGFAAVYRVLATMEESGRCRRGYFVEGLGAAQFALPGAVDRLRAMSNAREQVALPAGWHSAGGRAGPSAAEAVVLAATDPACPYGAALPWPDRAGETTGHKPGRKAGALVVLVEGDLVLYVERGGKSLLTWTEDQDRLRAAAESLATAVRNGALGRLTVQRADGTAIHGTPLADALASAGFSVVPQGLRLRG